MREAGEILVDVDIQVPLSNSNRGLWYSLTHVVDVEAKYNVAQR